MELNRIDHLRRRQLPVTPTGSNEACDAPFVHVWDFRDGRIERMTQFTDTRITRAALDGRTEDCGFSGDPRE